MSPFPFSNSLFRFRKIKKNASLRSQSLLLKWIVLTVALFVTLLVTCMLYAPGFLTKADKQIMADAVVLFIGPGQEYRYDEARRLIAEGYARYLIVPAYDAVIYVRDNDDLVATLVELQHSVVTPPRPTAPSYSNYFENTHIEALAAKRILDRLGLHSAILVSSPFHTRRIDMISSRVFNGSYTIIVVPTRFQDNYTARDWFNRDHRGKMLSEYLKIIWFLIYEPFI